MLALAVVGSFLVFGDAAVAAALAGIFSCLNTALSAWVLRRVGRTEAQVQQTHQALAAPRRAVYDADGQIIGTVLEIEHDGWPAAAVMPPQRVTDQPQLRRHADPDPQ